MTHLDAPILALAVQVALSGPDGGCADGIKMDGDVRLRAFLEVDGGAADTGLPVLERQGNRARFGASAPMKGRMTQIPYRAWTVRTLSDDQYRRVAEKFRGVFDYVIIREAKLDPRIPPLFHALGIKVLSYQYLGDLRTSTAAILRTTD